MDYYVLTQPGAASDATAIFSAGHGGDEPTAAVFTSRERARRFAAGWRDAGGVRRLSDLELLAWLIDLYRRGVRRLAVDPEQRAAQPLSRPTCSLPLLLADLAESLGERLHDGSQSGRGAWEQVVTYRCRGCGKVRRQFLGQRTPTCCGRDMSRVDACAARERLVLEPQRS